MAAANVLTTGSTALSSSDTTITTDTLFGLKGVVGDARVTVEVKDDGGAYNAVAALTPGSPAGILGAGTYRFTRVAGATCGVYSA